MQNKPPETSESSLRDVINRYSPIVRGHKGVLGAVLRLVERAVEYAPNFRAGITTLPVPDVIFQSRNLAGQTIATNNIMLATTFKRMETALQKSFVHASKPEASLDDKQKFVALAGQVQEDATVLGAQCFISKPDGPAKYQFVLQPNPGQHIPLADAFAAVKGQYKSGVNNQVELLRFGTDRPVILMRPVGGFKAASRKMPVS